MTIGGSAQWKINGLPVSVNVRDESTVSVRAGYFGSHTADGLKVGDSMRGPWWWGRLTVVRIDYVEQPPGHVGGGGTATLRWMPW